MQKERSTCRGFSLIEALLAVSLFALVIVTVVGALVYGEVSVLLGGTRARASLLAEEALEAVRNIRDYGFSGLADGTYGIGVTGGQWVLTSAPDTFGNFTRRLTIRSLSAGRKEITSNVSWQGGTLRSGSVTLVTYLDDWQPL